MSRILPSALAALLPLAVLLVPVDRAHATEEPPEAPDGDVQGIFGGEETDEYDAVAALVQDQGDGWVLVFCTATLIEPDLLLTAAHCFGVGTPTWAYFGSNPLGGDGFFVDVESQVGHQGWDGTLDPNGEVENDIALVRLTQSVPGIDPIPLSVEPGAALLGETGTHVGFGLSNGASEPATKRVADSEITELWHDFFLAQALDGSPCSGDSGGPMFVEDEAGDLELAGVTSFIIDSCGDRTGSTRVVDYLDWIEDPGSFEGGDDDDDAADDDDDEVVTLGELRDEDGSGCGGSSLAGRGGAPAWLLLLLAGVQGRRSSRCTTRRPGTLGPVSPIRRTGLAARQAGLLRRSSTRS